MSGDNIESQDFYLPNLVISYNKEESVIKYSLASNCQAIESRKNWKAKPEGRKSSKLDFTLEVEDSKEEKLLEAAKKLFDDKRNKLNETTATGSQQRFVPKHGISNTSHFKKGELASKTYTTATGTPEFRIRISNLPHETNEKDIIELLESVGISFAPKKGGFDQKPSYKVYIPKSRFDHRPLVQLFSFGFISVENISHANTIIQALNELAYGIVILKAEMAENRRPTF
ncbi:hypothetical protein HZS_96 [Henneguya salminicola]|nr:hypothetical protein HZS_96 [Henneguya salminicola]